MTLKKKEKQQQHEIAKQTENNNSSPTSQLQQQPINLNSLVHWLEEELEYELHSGVVGKHGSPQARKGNVANADSLDRSSVQSEESGRSLGQELLNLFWKCPPIKDSAKTNLVSKSGNGEMRRDFSFYNQIFLKVESLTGIPCLLLGAEIEDNQLFTLHLGILTYLAFMKEFLNTKNMPEDFRSEITSLLRINEIEEKTATSNSFSCLSCNKPAPLLARLIIGQNLRHRQCFRCCRCDSILRHGTFRHHTAIENETHYECLKHEREDLLEKIANLDSSQQTETVIENTVDGAKSDEKCISSDISCQFTSIDKESKEIFTQDMAKVFEAIDTAETAQKAAEIEDPGFDAEILRQEEMVTKSHLGEEGTTVQNENVDGSPNTQSCESTQKELNTDILSAEVSPEKQQIQPTETEDNNDTVENSASSSVVESPKVVFRKASENAAPETRINGDEKAVEKVLTPEKPVPTPRQTLPVPPPRRRRAEGSSHSRESSRSSSIDRAKIATTSAREKPVVSARPEKKLPLPQSPSRNKDILDEYPDGLNPFASSDEEDSESENEEKREYDDNLNPFADEDDDEHEEQNCANSTSTDGSSLNPFGRESEDERSPGRPKSTTINEDFVGSIPHRPPPPVPSKRLSLQALPQNAKRQTVSSSPSVGRKKRHAPPPPSGKGEKPPVPKRPDFLKKKKRPAPPPPLPLKRKIEMSEDLDEIQVDIGLKTVDHAQTDLEGRATEIEQKLEELIDKDPQTWAENDLFADWLKLVMEKCELWRREAELVHAWNQQYLDDFHSEIEFQLRCIIEKPESQKTEKDTKMEAKLLELLLEVIERKNRLVEAERPKNQEEIEAFADSESVHEKEDKEKKKKKKLKQRLKKIKKKLGHAGASSKHKDKKIEAE